MHLRATLQYDADAGRVAAMLADPAFVEEKLRASGALSHHADVVGDASREFTVTTRRQMPTDAIPAQFRSFVGSTLEVRHVEAWGAPAAGDRPGEQPGERRGTVVIEIVGAPVRYTGRLHLLPGGAEEPSSAGAGAGSQVVVDGDLRSSIALFASAVEEAAAGAVRAAIEAEERAGRAWLAARPG